jgi:tetratricopeptide (TPR) repeat protein
VLVYDLLVSDTDDKFPRYRQAIRASTQLARQDQNEEALRLVDDAIALAIGEKNNLFVRILSQHAAIISRHLGDWPRVKHYYQTSLAFNPEDPGALSGLADVAKEQGELELASEYAARCYKALMEGDDFLKEARLERLLKEWPEVAQH